MATGESRFEKKLLTVFWFAFARITALTIASERASPFPPPSLVTTQVHLIGKKCTSKEPMAESGCSLDCDKCLATFNSNGGCKDLLAGKDASKHIPQGCNSCGGTNDAKASAYCKKDAAAKEQAKKDKAKKDADAAAKKKKDAAKASPATSDAAVRLLGLCATLVALAVSTPLIF